MSREHEAGVPFDRDVTDRVNKLYGKFTKIRETAAVFNAASDGVPDRAQLMATMRRHGLTPALLLTT